MPRMLWSLTALGLAGSSLVAQSLPPLPQADGHKAHVLSLARAPDGAIWVGTYGRGIYVLPQGARTWRHMQDDTTSTSISWAKRWSKSAGYRSCHSTGKRLAGR